MPPAPLEPLLSIPHCTLTQLIPDTPASSAVRTPLTTGVLTLTAAPPTPLPTDPSTPSLPAKLLLSVGTLTLPLTPNTEIRSHKTNENIYLLTLPLESTLKGMLELSLPSFTDPSTATRFEELLVKAGFLTTGLVADAGDVVGAVEAAAAKVVDSVTGYVRDRVEGKERGEETRVPGAVKKVVGGVEGGTGTVAKGTGYVAGAVQGGAEKVGEWAGGKMGVGENTREVLGAAGELGSGIAEATGEVRERVGEGVAEVVEHEKGAEARGVVDGVRNTTGNVGSVVKDLATGTSVLWQAGVAGASVGGNGKEEEAGKEAKE